MLASILVVATPGRAAATAFVEVTSTADSGPGSLREAIVTANADPDTTTIDLPVDRVTIAIMTALPEFTAPVILRMKGATVRAEGAIAYGFVIGPGAAGSRISNGIINNFADAQIKVIGTATGGAESDVRFLDAGVTDAGSAGAAFIESQGANLVVGSLFAKTGIGPLVLTTEHPTAPGSVVLDDGFRWDGAATGSSPHLAHDNIAIDSRHGEIRITAGGLIEDGGIVQRVPADPSRTPRLDLDFVDVFAAPGQPAIDLRYGDLELNGAFLEGAPPLRITRTGFRGVVGARLVDTGEAVRETTYLSRGTDIIEYVDSPPPRTAQLSVVNQEEGNWAFGVAVEGLVPFQQARVVIGSVPEGGCTDSFRDEASNSMEIDGDGLGATGFTYDEFESSLQAGDLVRAIVLAPRGGEPTGENYLLPVLTNCVRLESPPPPPPTEPPPVIFLPGILGSEIWCDKPNGDRERLWLRIPAGTDDLGLQPDGDTSTSANCSDVGPVDAEFDPDHVTPPDGSGVVECVLRVVVCLKDVYGEGMSRMRALVGPENFYPFGWDWRKDTAHSLARLDALIDRARQETGASKVQLVAHSYGGLLARDYASDPERRAKLARVTTVGTPYLGAPKSAFPLITGTEMPGDFFGLELVFGGTEAMQRQARTNRGLFNLWPAPSLGSWLSVQEGVNETPLETDQIAQVIANAGGTESMWRAAQAKHDATWSRLDVGELPWRIVVSSGKATVRNIAFEDAAAEGFQGLFGDDLAHLRFETGDGTVPLSSQTLRSSLGQTIPGTYSDVKVVNLCDLEHAAEMAAEALYERLDDWFLHGTEPTAGASCPLQGRAAVVEATNARFSLVREFDGDPPPVDPSGPVDILDAEEAGLVDVIRSGDKAFAVLDPALGDLRIEAIPGEEMTVRFLRVDAETQTQLGPTLTTTGAVAVTPNGEGTQIAEAPPLGPGPAEFAADELLASLDDLDLALPDLFSAFDLPDDGAVITNELASLLGLGEEAISEALQLPALPEGFDPETATLDAIADAIEAQDCTIDFLRGGAGGRTTAPGENDVLQARCLRTLEDLEAVAGEGPFEYDTADFLESLGGTLGLGAEGAWDADLTVTLVFGVDLPAGGDPGGFYLHRDTGAELEVGGELTIDGLSAEGPLAPEGTVNGGLSVTAGPNGGPARIRVAGLGTAWQATAQGSASADLTLPFPGGSLRWQGAWEVNDGGATTTEQTLTGTVEIPGATDGDDEPVSLVLAGTQVAEGWRITGELDSPEGATFAGFELRALDADFLATDTSFTGGATARVVVPVGDSSITADVDFDLGVDQATIDVVATSPELELFDGAVSITDVDLHLTGQVGTTTSLTGELTGGILTALDGDLVVDSFTAALGSEGQFTVEADTVELSLGDGTVMVTLDATSLSFGPDASGALLSVETATGVVPGLSNLTVSVTDLVVRRDGTFEVGTITASATDLPTLELGGFLAVTLAQVEVTIDPDTFAVTLSARGSIDFDSLDGLPFTPIVRVGDQAVDPDEPSTNAFDFTVRIEDGEFVPVDFGPIVLGWEDLEVNGHVLDGEIELGGFQDGEPVPDISGRFGISGGQFGDGLTVDIDGTHDESGRLDLDGSLSLPRLGFSAFTLTDVELTAGVTLLETADGLAFLPRLDSVGVGRIDVSFGGFATASANNVELVDFFPAPGEPLVEFGEDGLSVDFGDAEDLGDLEELAGWEGSVSNFAFGADFVPYALAGFGVDVTLPPTTRFDFPTWLPIEIREAGLRFPGIASDDDGAVLGGFEIADLADFAVRVSLTLAVDPPGAGNFGLEASVDGLEIDIAKLVAGEFPITNLEAISAEVPAFEFKGLEVGGALSVGVLSPDLPGGTPEGGPDEEAFYLRIAGQFKMDSIGAGVDLVVTEYGPLIAEVTAPLGIPIDPSGLILASVTGGISFGARSLPDPDPDDPQALLDMPAFDDLGDVKVTKERLEELIRPALAAERPTWETGASLYLTGHLTHLAMPIISGDVSLGASYGSDGELDVLLKGEAELYGMPLGEGGFRLDLGDPIAPAWQFAFASPPPASPIAFLMPGRVDLGGVLRTDGLAHGTVLGLRGLLNGLRTGAVTVTEVQTVFDRVAASLEDNRVSSLDGFPLRPLTKAVLDSNGDGTVSTVERRRVITRSVFLSRVLALIPTPTGASIAKAVTNGQHLLFELTSAAADPESVLDLVAFQDALVGAVRSAVVRAGQEFLRVADPVLVIEGAFQPQILGIPLGAASDSAALRIDKGGLEVRVSTSFKVWMNRMSNLATVGAVGPLVDLALLGVPEDRVTIAADLPTGNLLRALMDGAASPAAQAAASSWGVTIEGELGYFGLKFVELSGMLVPPGNEQFVRSKSQLLFDGQRFDPTDVNRPVPLLQRQHFDNLVDVGGLVLTGGLQAPKLVTDPVGLFRELDLAPPDDPLQLPTWLGELAGTLGQIDSPGLVQLYLPPPLEADRGHVVGRWDSRILSLPISSGEFALDNGGLDVTGRLPALGLDGTLRILPPRKSGAAIGLPRLSLDVAVEPAVLRQMLLDLGVPAGAIPDLSGLPTGQVQVYSPGFDPKSTLADGSPDLLRRNGGIKVLARLKIPGVGTEALFRLDVAMGADGTPSSVTGTASLNGGTLGPLTLHQFTGTVRIDDAGFNAHVSGSGTVFGNTVAVEGDLSGDGFGRLVLSIDDDGVDLSGFSLTGSLVAVRDAVGTRVEVAGRLALPSWLSSASERASVAVNGSFDSAGNASLTIALQKMQFGALAITGTFTFDRTNGVVKVGVVGGSVLVPGTNRTVSVNGFLSSVGLGNLSIATNGPLTFSGKPFTIDGTFGLSRVVESGSVVTRVRVTNADFLWKDLGTFTVTRFDVASNGSATVVLPARSFTLPGDARLSLPSVDFRMDAGGTNARLSLGESRLEIPGVAPDCVRFKGTCKIDSVDRRLRLPAFTVSTGDFTHTLLDGSFDLGPQVKVSGRLVFEKTGNVFGVRITGPSAGVAARVQVGDLFDVGIGAVVLKTDGSILIDVNAPVLGTAVVGVRHARLKVKRDPGLLGALSVRLDGGQLYLPVGAPIDLPSVDFSAELTFAHELTFGLDLGPAFKVSSATYALGLDADGVLSLKLAEGTPSLTALAGSVNMKLVKLDMRSDGTVDLDVSGRLNLFGHKLAQATLDVDLVDGVLVVKIDDVGLDLGFVAFEASGTVRSNGRFVVSGSFGATFGVCPVGCLRGSVAVTVSSTSGISGAFAGQVCGFGACAGGSGSLTSYGRLRGCAFMPFGRHCETVELGDGQPDEVAPTFAQPSGRTVRRDVVGGSDRVVYPQPTATDESTATVAVTCTPASGSTFNVGTTTVTCVARDKAGNTTTRSFILHLIDTFP